MQPNRHLVIASFLIFLPFLYQYFTKPQPPTLTPIQGNEKIAKFYKAKKVAFKIYEHFPQTFYCSCEFLDASVHQPSCSYKPKIHSKRSQRVEWEHLVPASQFGRKLPGWKHGHERCRRKGKPYRGRRCARKVHTEFRMMEADLYNLVPAVGELNQRRGRLPMGLLANEPFIQACHLKLGKKVVEPDPSLRGFIARTYLYMHAAYPQFAIIEKDEYLQLMLKWHSQHPPGKLEQTRAGLIEKYQGNPNPYSKYAHPS